jgi:hypothetical protein
MVFWGEPDPRALISILMKKAQYRLQRYPAVFRASSGYELDKRPSPWQANEITAEEVIPLDSDDFKRFLVWLIVKWLWTTQHCHFLII